VSRLRANELTNVAGNFLSTPEQIVQGRAKSWWNLNGTGVIAERDSFNVSSYVDNGTGDYTANFTAAMVNANYALAGTCGNTSITAANGLRSIDITDAAAPTTAAVRFATKSSAGEDVTRAMANIFGD
jgi:hypothetical protein